MTYESPKPFDWNFCGTCGTALIQAHDGQSIRPHCSACRRYFYRNPVPAACCFVARGRDELLFTQRAVEPCKGEWTLPGGFIELGESAEEGVLRELHEETNLHATTAELLGVSTKQSPNVGAVLVLGYLITDWWGEEAMRPDSDALAVQFFHRDLRPPMPFSVHRELLACYDIRFPA